MTVLSVDAKVEGVIAGSGGTLLVRPVGDWRSAALPWKVGGAAVAVAEEAFTVGEERFTAGTYVVAGCAGGACGDP